MALVKGKWTFKDVLTESFSGQDVYFLSNQTRYSGMNCSDAVNAEMSLSLNYVFEEPVDLDEHDVYNFEDLDKGVMEGWHNDAYRTIDFGETEQPVSDDFYAWLVENTLPKNIQIDVTENGTTTLATAGKYCDRNIDVNVNVEDSGMAVFEALAQGTIEGDYTSDKVTSLRNYAFSNCPNLTSISFPNCTTIGTYSFYSCTNLESVNLPMCTTIRGSNAFNVSGLKTISLPNLTTITNGNRTLAECDELEEVNMPKLTSVKDTTRMFATDKKLKKVSFLSLSGCTISANTFYICNSLRTIILGGSALNPLENVNAFSNTPIANGTGYIYVPDNLVEEYKQATNWSNFASQIKRISELEE